MKTGIELIKEERRRQVVIEGWDLQHDIDHQNNEQLARAAVCYAKPVGERFLNLKTGMPSNWPWVARWWKPSPNNRVRDLVKAGALIAAEIDRLQAMYKKE